MQKIHCKFDWKVNEKAADQLQCTAAHLLKTWLEEQPRPFLQRSRLTEINVKI